MISHIRSMAKASGRGLKNDRYDSVGRAADGVVILRPAIPPKHFTQSQIEKTVDVVRDAAGRFVDRRPTSSSRASK
jgi:hypothetical protein